MVGSHRLVVLYGVGGLSDVGRHAIPAALERNDVEHITILTRYPKLIEESRWNCGCPEPHAFSDADKARMTVVPVQAWSNPADLVSHFAGATAVISCLGNRQPLFGHCESADGNAAVIHAMENIKDLKRVVVCSSVGIEEDWPPLEFFKLGYYAMSCLFMTLSRSNFNDLTKMERAYKSTSEDEVDFLFVRPVGLGEDIVPVNRWAVQQQKNVDTLHFDMAKLDCARYMVEEAINPTRHRGAVVLGAPIDTPSAVGATSTKPERR
jgi:NAD(P)H-binding